jgi:hypothetical protein
LIRVPDKRRNRAERKNRNNEDEVGKLWFIALMSFLKQVLSRRQVVRLPARHLSHMTAAIFITRASFSVASFAEELNRAAAAAAAGSLCRKQSGSITWM